MKKLQSKLSSFLATNGPIINLFGCIQTQTPSMTLAAEFKRASPSKGLINPDVSAGAQATQYYIAGASVISVLTEERWFKGSLEDLTEARIQTQQTSTNATQARPVILRKDFIISKYQILEAASAGADTILLIVAVTPKSLLKELIVYSRELGMEPLVEVHAPEELNVAIESGAKVIGVNNRNLHTFQMDLATTDRTAAQMDALELAFHHDVDDTSTKIREYALCALSGMSTAQDVHRYRKLGVGMVLIGESLMRAPDPKIAISALCLHPDEYEAHQTNGIGVGGAYVGGTNIVKICGVTNPEDASIACRAGANLIGVIFAERSKRKVDVNQAKEVVNVVRAFGERNSRADLILPKMHEKSAVNSTPVSMLVQKANLLQQIATSRNPLVVGVFQNQSSEFIEKMVSETGIDIVQLHGSEGMDAAAPERCGGIPALRVVDIPLSDDSNSNKEDVVSQIIQGLTSDPLAILLDTTMKGGVAGGGTGKTFDWKIAESIQNRGLPVIIAGGLKPDNIGEAVSSVRPWGVDVSSGTEQRPGKKDPEKVKSFVTNARIASEEAAKGF